MSKGRDILKDMLASDGSKTESSAQAAPVHRSAGALRAMNVSLGRLNEEAAEAKTLRAAIAAGDMVVELDPNVVEESFARDRFLIEDGAAFAELKKSIEDNGQQVPILVRPHPTADGKYQIAYGHRRHQAAQQLKRPVRAVVRSLSDRELILAQGQENGLRADLSFIERAWFARKLEALGYDREIISNALGVDKPEASRLLQVAICVPEEMVGAVGAAPKIGRPRWLAMAEKLKKRGAQTRALNAIKQPMFGSLDSNRRFELIWKVVADKPETPDPESIKAPGGRTLATLVRSKSATKLTLLDQDFAAFVVTRLAGLASEFDEKNERNTDG